MSMMPHLPRRVAELFQGRFGRQQSNSTVTFQAVQERVAEQLYHRALHDGAWAAEIGPYGSSLFEAEASERLRHIALGDGAGGPPAP
jgi:hypothetical protein